MILGKDNDILQVAKFMTELWTPLTKEQQCILINHIYVRRFAKGDIIYRENDKPRYLMCLLRGNVKIYKEGVGGRHQIVRMVSPAGFFGYRAGFASEDYITSASAFENSSICLVPLDIIKQFIRENNLVAIFFIKELSAHLGNADERTVNLTQKHIRGRLAESLIHLKDKYGVEEDGSTISIYLSREDLASLSNMTTSNAIRTLSSFANEHLIAIDGRKIKIMEDAELRKISRMG